MADLRRQYEQLLSEYAASHLALNVKFDNMLIKHLALEQDVVRLTAEMGHYEHKNTDTAIGADQHAA